VNKSFKAISFGCGHRTRFGPVVEKRRATASRRRALISRHDFCRPLPAGAAAILFRYSLNDSFGKKMMVEAVTARAAT